MLLLNVNVIVLLLLLLVMFVELLLLLVHWGVFTCLSLALLLATELIEV